MKALLISMSLLAMSFSSFAEDISENQLQRYIKALPAVVNWSQSQSELDTVNLGGMLGSSDGVDSSSVMDALGHIKEHELYTEFEALTKQYGFTPEQLVTVGSEVSMAYLENLKAGMSEENKQRVNQAMSQSLTASSSDAGTRSMAGALEGVKASTATANVSESNVNLVKQYMPQLKELFAMLQ